MLYDMLCTVPRLMEFVHALVAHVVVKQTEEVSKVRFNSSPPAANTRGATLQKDKAQAADKGKGKMVEPEKPKKAMQFPLQTGRVFKIHDKESAPPALAINQPEKKEKKTIEVPPRVAKVLKLVDDEDGLRG